MTNGKRDFAENLPTYPGVPFHIERATLGTFIGPTLRLGKSRHVANGANNVGRFTT